nr:competence type IV pilus minor pilin ComGG [Enterococcus larvae]
MKGGLSVKKNQGSVLLAVLLFFYLFSLFFLLMVIDYRLTHSYSESTQNFYTAAIIKAMFLSDFTDEGESAGRQSYSEGTVEYWREEEVVKLIITVAGKHYTFHEKLEGQSSD